MSEVPLYLSDPGTVSSMNTRNPWSLISIALCRKMISIPLCRKLISTNVIANKRNPQSHRRNADLYCALQKADLDSGLQKADLDCYTALVCTGPRWSARASIGRHGSAVFYTGPEWSERVGNGLLAHVIAQT